MFDRNSHNTLMHNMEQLYNKYYQQLFLYAVTFLNDDDEARDAVSDVFSVIWSQWLEQRQATAVNANYLYKLTRNKCLDLLRHDKARRNYADFLAHTHQPDSEEDVLDYERRIARLREVIEQLPEPGKTILECCYFKRLTYQQTADHLQLTLVVIRKNMLKVFNILRKELKKPINQV